MQQLTEGWSKVQFFHQGDDYFDEIGRAIDSAQSEIFVESYIFEIDHLTQPLLEKLGAFRKRGGHVQILVDGFGSYFWIDAIQSFCEKYDLNLRVFRPLPHSIRWFRRFFVFTFFRFFFLFRRLNRRNHRKTVIIDKKVAFLGSFNWTQVHSKRIMGRQAWRDSGVRLEGPSILNLYETFQDTWRESRKRTWGFWPRRLNFRASRFRISEGFRLNSRRRDRLSLSRDLIGRFKNSEGRIWIVSAYFLPKRSFLRAIRNAALRGVDVKVLWPGPTDVPVVKWAAHRILINLIKAGASIYEYQPSILHAKYLIIDQWASIGSANLNHRSYFHDLEIEAAFQTPDYVQSIENQWKTDLSFARPVTLQELENLPFWQKFLSSLAYRLRYLL